MPTRKNAKGAPKADVEAVLKSLKRLGNKKIRDEMGPRYGVRTDKAFGVSMANMLKLAKSLGRNHELALALWDTGWYEARMLASMVDEPERVTPAQMDRWCSDFDNWGIVDTVCFKLFDQSPQAFDKVAKWAKSDEEFVQRAAFVLLACLALHGRSLGDEPYIRCLPLVEAAAADERNFVRKGVNWALRAVGERSAGLNAAAVVMAQRMSKSANDSARWVGKDALRQLASPAVQRRLAARKPR